jgi:coenzyme Q-binding protein COQ10
MPSFHDSQISPYSPQQLYDLVVDIEKYPEFLPWCRAARIVKREENRLEAELVISFKSITESYVSEVTLYPVSDENPSPKVNVHMLRGPFEYLENKWKFSPEDGGTRIDFLVDFRFRSRMLDMLVGSLFGKASAKMAQAFKTRAEQLYGNSAK